MGHNLLCGTHFQNARHKLILSNKKVIVKESVEKLVILELLLNR